MMRLHNHTDSDEQRVGDNVQVDKNSLFSG